VSRGTATDPPYESLDRLDDAFSKLITPPKIAVTDSSYCQRVKVGDVIALLEENGWYLDRQRGSHRQFRHHAKSGTVTIAGKPSDDLKAGTLASVLRQAGLKGQSR